MSRAVGVIVAEFRACVRVDAGGMDWAGPLGRRALTWGEIARFACNPVNHRFFVTLVDGTHPCPLV